MKRAAPALFFLVATLWPQQTIRVTTRLVEVNVIVRDKNGPVKGLTQADFALFDGGKPRRIEFFAVNEVHAARKAAEALPPNVYSNEPEHRGMNPVSATVVLLDGVNTRIADQMYARKQFLEFLGQIQPPDRIAVYTMGSSLRILNDFTSDASRLAATVARFRGRLDSSRADYAAQDFELAGLDLNDVLTVFLRCEGENDRDKRVNLTVEALEAVAQRIGSIPGRKNLIWVSASFPFAIMNQQTPKTYSREVNRAAKALNAANIAIYPVDARGLVGLTRLDASNGRVPSNSVATIPPGQETMGMLADATGGRVFKNDNDIKRSIRSVLDDSEVTYTLAFQPDSDLLDNSFRRVKVKVNRPGVEVRHREGYLASADSPVTPESRGRALMQAAASPLESAGIRARVQVDRGAGLGVSVRLNAADLALELSDGRHTAALDAVFVQRAADGRELSGVTYALRPNLDESQYRDALANGLGFAKMLTPVGGAAQLKVVILDRATGRVGSVIVPL